MTRLAVLLTLLALAGCDWGGADSERKAGTARAVTDTMSATTPAPVAPSPTKRVTEAIRSCEVKSIVFGRGEKTYITFRDGRTIRSKSLDRKRIARVAHERAKACNILIGAELIEETPCPIRVLAGRLVALCPSILAPRRSPGGESGIFAGL